MENINKKFKQLSKRTILLIGIVVTLLVSSACLVVALSSITWTQSLTVPSPSPTAIPTPEPSQPPKADYLVKTGTTQITQGADMTDHWIWNGEDAFFLNITITNIGEITTTPTISTNGLSTNWEFKTSPSTIPSIDVGQSIDVDLIVAFKNGTPEPGSIGTFNITVE